MYISLVTTSLRLTVNRLQCRLTVNRLQCRLTVNRLQCRLTVNRLQCRLTLSQLQCRLTVNQLQCRLTVNRLQCRLTVNQLQCFKGGGSNFDPAKCIPVLLYPLTSRVTVVTTSKHAVSTTEKYLALLPLPLCGGLANPPPRHLGYWQQHAVTILLCDWPSFPFWLSCRL